MIAKLREKPCSKEELTEAISKFAKTKEAARKKVERGLKKLCEMGLVEKQGDLYYWYIYPNLFRDYAELESKRLHSQQLIPGLKSIAGLLEGGLTSIPTSEDGKPIPHEDLRILEECAKEHLQTYPHIWKTLEEYAECNREADRIESELQKELERRLEVEVGLKPRKYFSGTESFISKTMSKLIYTHIAYFPSQGTSRFFQYDDVKGELWFHGTAIARGKHLHNAVKKFLDRQVEDENVKEKVRRAEEKRAEAYRKFAELQGHMRRLILKIRSGEPLLGRCRECPEVYFKPQSQKVGAER
jgi:YesN/AraC family two-component response regulator